MDELDRAGCLLLADALPDTPRNSESIGPLRSGKARAWIKGALPRFDAAIVQWEDLSEEPVGFGSDPVPLFGLLQQVPGWTCIDVDAPVARPLGELIRARLGKTVHYLESVGYQLLQPVREAGNPAVRALVPGDSILLVPEVVAEFARHRFICPVPEAPPTPGYEWFTAGAIVDGVIAGFVYGCRTSGKFAGMSACVLEAHRNRGYATACASLAAKYFQGLGLIPEWSTGLNNPASMAIPRKLGFTEVQPHSIYVVAQ